MCAISGATHTHQPLPTPAAAPAGSVLKPLDAAPEGAPVQAKSPLPSAPSGLPSSGQVQGDLEQSLGNPVNATNVANASPVMDALQVRSQLDEAGVPSDQADTMMALLQENDIPMDQARSLMQFSLDNKVPIGDLLKVASNSNYGTGQQKLMAMQTYAIVFDAANNNKLLPGSGEMLRDNVLPNLLQGNIKMDFDPALGAKGSKATYRFGTDTYTTGSQINIANPVDRAVTIHEMMHAMQDSQQFIHPRYESELMGHAIETEYLLFETGVLQNQSDGSTAVDLEKARAVFDGQSLGVDTFDIEKSIIMDVVNDNLEHHPENNQVSDAFVEKYGFENREEAVQHFARTMGEDAQKAEAFDPQYLRAAEASSASNNDEALRTLMFKDGIQQKHSHHNH